MPFDKTKRAHKKQLYPVLRAISDLDPHITPELLIDRACGKPLSRGTDYIKNVAKGDFNRSIAQLVYEYLRDHHFELAHQISEDIFPETPAMRWRQILDERAIEDAFKVVLVKPTMSLVVRDSDLEKADHTIAFGRRFLFELDIREPCHCIALQGMNDQWHPIPLEKDELSTFLEPGRARLPRLANGLADPLSEETHAGMRDFVLITSQTPDIPLSIDRLIAWVNTNEPVIHRTQVRFTE